MECLWITNFFQSVLICKYSQALTWKLWFNNHNLVPNLSLHLHGQSEASSDSGGGKGRVQLLDIFQNFGVITTVS